LQFVPPARKTGFMIAEANSTVLDLIAPFAVAVAALAVFPLAALKAFGEWRRAYNKELGGFEVKLGPASARVDHATGTEESRSTDAEAVEAAADHGQLDVDVIAAKVVDVVHDDVIAMARDAVPEASVHADEYHAEGLAQSKLAFIVSLVFASLGFVLIATAVIAVLLGAQVGAGVITLVSGSVVEAVASLFFVQSNRARTTMVEFFDRLRVDRSLEESLKLADAITDPLIRSRVQTLLAVRLARAEAADSVLQTVMAAPAGPTGSASAGAGALSGDAPAGAQTT
jgi:hypothetical protein